MPLNLWSRSQRDAVHQTVRAHCTNYDLHLVALVVSPSSTDCPDVYQDAWRISVLDQITEPVIMAYDYSALLSEASGRVIILSNFADRPSSHSSPPPSSNPSQIDSPLAFFSLKSRIAAAQNLAEMLEFQGIRVSSIQFGPLAQYSTQPPPVSHSINRYVMHSSASLSLRVSCIHRKRSFSRPFGTCAGLELSDIF
jgi:hypothetical protein